MNVPSFPIVPFLPFRSAIERRAVVADTAGPEWPENLHPVLRQVLARRALGSPAELELRLGHLVPVGRFAQLADAVDLLLRHRERHVVIVGDFDADGATSTALGVLTLRRLGFARVSHFVPDRFELGYGLSPEAVTRLVPERPSLIMTVDNGISSHAGVARARSAGIDVLVTDHHLPPDELPDASVIVNPNLHGDPFPGRQLAGVGVVFYLMAALGNALGRPRVAAEYLDLVALGTVADLARLDHGNRILVDQGLKRIRAARCRPGIRALCGVAALDTAAVGAQALGFQLAPRLNAAGRLDDMALGIRCLITDSDAEARELAERLDALNRERRRLEARMKSEAFALVDGIEVPRDAGLRPVICLVRDDWHEGLVGIVAARVKDRHHRPTFAFAPAGADELKGSGRSIPGFHLRDALAEVAARAPGIIERFGGHAMAAGLTIRRSAFAPFAERIAAVAERTLPPEALACKILTDGPLDPTHMNVEVAGLLRDAGPWGQGFPEPVFDGCFELLEQRILKSAHLKLLLRPVDGTAELDAIAFNRAACDWAPGSHIEIAYRLEVNDFPATPRVQLVVEHVVEHAAAD